MTRGPQSVYATLRYEDPHAAIAWLVDVLGFTKHEIHEGENGSIEHAQLAFGDDLIMLGTGEHSGPLTLYLGTDDIDGRHQRAVEAGADVVEAPVDRDYGSREFTVRDPGGNYWALGTYRPEAG